MKNVTISRMRERLLWILSGKSILPDRVAADLMMPPACIVDAEDTIADVDSKMTCLGVNTVLVVRSGVAVGILARRIVKKALLYGLGEESAVEYMDEDFERAASGDEIQRIREIVIGKNQRLVPVVDGQNLVGIITRNCLLRFLYDMRGGMLLDAEENVSRSDAARQPQNVANRMRESLPERVLERLKQAGVCAERLGMRAYAVGGFARDLVMRGRTMDIDIVVEGEGGRFAEVFGREEDAQVLPHHRFATATLLFSDGLKMDVASARLEYYMEPGALPEVEYGSLRQDMRRRDVTINTLAIRLNPSGFGELIDVFDAQRDIREKKIRVLHSLSFVEDPTRILRAVRFERRFGFSISRHTRNLIRNAVCLRVLNRISRHRFFSELERILQEKDPASVFARLAELGVSAPIHPQLVFDREHLELFEEAQKVLGWFAVSFPEEKVEKWAVLFLVLLAPLSQAEAKKLAKDFGVRSQVREWVRICKDEGAGILHRLLPFPSASRKAVYGIFSVTSIEVIFSLMILLKRIDIKEYISLYFAELKGIQSLVNGEDLIQLGYSPGPQFRRIFDAILEGRLSGDLQSREEEIAFVREMFPQAVKPESS